MRYIEIAQVFKHRIMGMWQLTWSQSFLLKYICIIKLLLEKIEHRYFVRLKCITAARTLRYFDSSKLNYSFRVALIIIKARQPRISLKLMEKIWIICLGTGLDIQLNFKVIKWQFHWVLHTDDAQMPSPVKCVTDKIKKFYVLKL